MRSKKHKNGMNHVVFNGWSCDLSVVKDFEPP